MSLSIEHLSVSVDKKYILHDISLTIQPGELHVIMGPNGSGKSTLANSLMGHPKYSINSGKIILDGTDITEMSVDKKAKAGLFLSMQYQPEIEGVSVSHFLRMAVQARTEKKQNPITFLKDLKKRMGTLGINESFAHRDVHVGFSGGEKKRLEILQLLTLRPKYVILDETDSGLDVDALKVVADGINAFISKDHGIILITHYNRILQYVLPDMVHLLKDGKICMTGDKNLARHIEKNGYSHFSS